MSMTVHGGSLHGHPVGGKILVVLNGLVVLAGVDGDLVGVAAEVLALLQDTLFLHLLGFYIWTFFSLSNYFQFLDFKAFDRLGGFLISLDAGTGEQLPDIVFFLQGLDPSMLPKHVIRQTLLILEPL